MRLNDNQSNYVLSTSNILVNRIREEIGFGSNYTLRLDGNHSNYVLSTSNILVNRIREEIGFGSNYTLRLDGNHSNYVLSTSNILVNRIRDEVGFGSNYTLRLDGNSSNYVLSTSNILADMIKNNKSSQWTTSNNMIFYNTSNVGIGTFAPTSKLHLFDDTNRETKLTIQNNFPEFSSATTPTFTIGSPSASGPITTTANSPDKFMIFTTAGINHTFTVPAGGINCDILMIGGGGGGDGGWSPGGAGACIVAINQTLPTGSCVVNVGGGGVGFNGGSGYNGGDSYIQIGGSDRYRAKGGGSGSTGYNKVGNAGGCGSGPTAPDNGIILNGGAAVTTNVVNGLSNIGPIITSTYAVLGNAGGNNFINGSGGGGGIGTPGAAAPATREFAKGGNGKYDVIINSYTYNFRDYFANGGNNFGVQDGTTGNYYIGGGGSAFNGGGSLPPVGGLGGGGGYNNGIISPIANTGSGSGGTVDGATGIIIIRYRSPASTSSSSSSIIELIRGTSIDANTDYKIGNYGGEFKIVSSLSATDTDRFLLQTDGAFRFNNLTGTSIASLTNAGNLTITGTITNNSDSRIKKDIEDINYDNALRMILAIKPKTYKYIDEEKGKLLNYGFIAQEIKSIIPDVTDNCKDFLPNIMKIAICDNNKIYLDLTNYTDVPLNENDRKINIKFKNGGGDNFNITEINSEYFVVNKKTFEKDSNILKYIDCPNGEVFVYGYEVNDFQILKKDYIYTLNVCATQELHRKIESQDARIKELEEKLEQILGNK